MPDAEFPPLPIERLTAMNDPARYGDWVVSMSREILALRKNREVMFALIGKLQALEAVVRKDESRSAKVQMALADLWMWREKQVTR